MNLDDMIRNSYEHEHINLGQIPNKQKETLDYILNYSQNRTKNPLVNVRNKFINLISSIQIADAIGVLIFIIILFVIPSIIHYNKQTTNGNLAENPSHQVNIQQPASDDFKDNSNTSKNQNIDILDLSAELLETYNKYSKDKNDELLRGLGPEEVCRLYFFAESKKDYDTVYSLYLNEGNYQIPDKQEWTKDIDNAINHENTAKFLKVLKEDVKSVEVIDRETNAIVQINHINYKKDNQWGNYTWFSVLKSKAGIWKVQFMPLQ